MLTLLCSPLALLPLFLLAPADAAAPYDLVLRGGKIVDGSGNPWFEGDVAIAGDRIARIGRLPPGAGAREIDARGLVVAPGFIDIHSHSDDLLLEDGNAESKIRQGVTTEVLGESSSPGPASGKLKPRFAMVKGERVEWTTLGGYFAALEKGGVAVNVASYCGLGTLWRCVLGDAFDRPSPAQWLALQALLEEALRDGAFGLSSLVAQAPDLLATTDDIVELCRVVGRHGGIYSTHIRNEGTEVLDAIREAISIGERAGVPVDIIHLKIAEQKLWGRMADIVTLIGAARQRGVNVQANVYPYTRGNNDLASIVPPWAHEGGTDQFVARLRDPAERERIRRDVLNGLPGWYNHYLAVGGDWSRMLVNANLSAANKRFEGLSMDRIIAQWRDEGAQRSRTLDSLDVLFDFLVAEGGAISTIFAHHTEEDMMLALSQPWCSVGSDGLAHAVDGPLRRGKPHPRSFGTFPRVLGVYVRERGLLGLEEAVRKMTSQNAAKLGLRDRGFLREGLQADIAIFDAATVIDRSTYLEPFQYPLGIEYVVVNGVLTIEKGKHTGVRAGRILRRG